jgi:hypothetical protein
MITDQLLTYIKQQLSLKVSKDAIVNSLKQAGWADADISEAFRSFESGVAPTHNFANANSVAEHHVSSTSNRRKKILLVTSIVVLLGVASGVAYGFYSGMFLSPSSLVSESIEKTSHTTSATYDITLGVDISGAKSVLADVGQLLSPGVDSSKITVTVKGSYDSADAENLKSSSVFSFGAGSSSLSAEFRVLNDNFYGRLIKAPSVGILPMFSAFENKWVSFPYKSPDGELVDNPITSFSGVDASMINKLTPEQEETLYKMSREASFIKVTKKLPPETITGEMSYHFMFDLDREGIISYFQALKEYINSIGKDDSAMSAFDPTAFSKELDKIENFSGEIWIGRKDRMIHKVVSNFDMKVPDVENEKIKLNMVGVFSGWNEPVSIVAPTDSVPFETFLSNIFSGAFSSGSLGSSASGSDSLEEARRKGKEAAIKANMSNLRAWAEIGYDSTGSYLGWCASENLKISRSAIEEAGGSSFVCNEAPQSYAISVKFPSNSGYWCVDSTGSSKATTTLPTGTVCPS